MSVEASAYCQKTCQFRITVLFAASLMFLATSHHANTQQADVTIAPKRVVFEGRLRSAEVALINRGSGHGSYRVDLIDLAIDDDGAVKELPIEPLESHSAKPLLRFSPREVTVGPGQSQIVRLMVRKPEDLPPGEYRSHLRIRVIPPPDAYNNIEPVKVGNTGVAIKLLPIYGQSIPVVVREGDLEVEVGIAKADLLKNEKGELLDLVLRRSGSRSSYGDLVVMYNDGSGQPVEVGIARGVACYPPAQQRPFRLSLNPPDGVKLQGGSLSITYREPVENGGKVLAETTLKL